MPAESVQPLRIFKGTPTSSPTKMPSSSPYRPLAEIGPTEKRRNSPSYNQATKQMILKNDAQVLSSSPRNAEHAASPRSFWQERDPASPLPHGRSSMSREVDDTVSPQRRSSIENLKRVSRVKNSSMFEREQQSQYDPAAPQLDRPHMPARPLSLAFQGNAFDGYKPDSLRKTGPTSKGHRRGQSLTSINTSETMPGHLNHGQIACDVPSHANDIHADYEGDDTKAPLPRPLRRQAKSVTFDSGPPEINEYETVTPDPSSVASGSRESSMENDDSYEIDYDAYDGESLGDNDSFDASLEDTAKTPVVLPGDWHGSEQEHIDEASKDQSVLPARSSPMPVIHTADSNSDGERPLPPLPGTRTPLTPGLAAAVERVGNNPRNLPSPPRPAGISKAEIINMQKHSAMSVEERLRLMGLQDVQRDTSPVRSDSTGRAARAAKLNAVHSKTRGLAIHIHEDETAGSVSSSQTSRKDSEISQKLNQFNAAAYYDGSGYGDDLDYANLDPDVPIPSLEGPDHFSVSTKSDTLNTEGAVPRSNARDVPDLYPSNIRDSAKLHPPVTVSQEGMLVWEDGHKSTSSEDDGPPTPRPATLALADVKLPSTSSNLMPRESVNSLPEFESMLDDDDFKSGLASFLSRDDAESVTSITPEEDAAKELEAGESQGASVRPRTPEDQVNNVANLSDEKLTEDDLCHSPGSVIHHEILQDQQELPSEYIPERYSSIKAPGSKLKARPSLTATETETLTSQIQVQDEHTARSTPKIPRKSSRRRSSIGVANSGNDFDEDEDVFEDTEIRKSSLQQIQLDSLTTKDDFGLSLELGEEFDRVIEAQKKGYMMRETTKVVVARARDFSDEKMPSTTPAAELENGGSTPAARKSSGQAKPWTTEQWNGKSRRKSIRTPSGSRKHQPDGGSVPPLPGQESSVTGLNGESSTKEAYEECEWEDGSERGRLFVKVMGLKDLDLPLPRHEKTHFQLTLDNGLHCVTTSWLELSQTAPIGQEFELVVLNDLEFQLTLQTKLNAPPQTVRAPTPPASPTKGTPSNMKKKSLSHLLMSPKKRKEAEARRCAEEHQQREREAAAARHRASPTKPQPRSAWDLLHDLVGSDGSFARAYISLKSFEASCYGQALTVDVPCYNEWAEEHDASVIESMRSKRGNRSGEVVRMPPYQVGKLQLMLLYVPKPKGAKDEDMPRSLNSAMREMDKAREAGQRKFEGVLSQQGGDCPYWRRRFFRLSGTKLTAFHESTRQPRATINLVKAVKLIDDKSSLVQDPTNSTSKKGRRKSAFAEEEEGYMFVEEGFRVRFANGETIDFYADSAAEKAEWMRVLSEVIGKAGRNGVDGQRGWTELVLRREQRKGFDRKPLPSGSVKRKEPQAETTIERPSSEQGQKRSLLESHDVVGDLKPPPALKDHSPAKGAKMRAAMSQAERRAKARSMIF